MPLTNPLVKGVVYPDGYVMGTGSDGRQIRARFFDKTLIVFNIATGAAESTAVKSVTTLSRGYVIAQTFRGLEGAPSLNRSNWAPHPKEWYIADELNGAVVDRLALTASEAQYFADNADFKAIGWTKDGAAGTANQDPRHFWDSESKKEGEVPVANLFFKIGDDGKPVRCDKDGKLMKNDGTYVNSADDPKAAAAAAATEDDKATEATSVMGTVKKYGKTLLWICGGALVVGVGAWAFNAFSKPRPKGK